jgi:WD40 repeat protein
VETNLPPSGDAKLSLQVLKQIDEVCLRFEDAWLAGSRPQLSDYLDEVDERNRSDLFVELVKIAMHHRRGIGETPTPEEYVAIRPEAADAVRAAFAAALPSGTIVTTPDGRVPAGHQPAAGLPALPVVPDYEILGVLGKGGMGVVYRARHTVLGRVVALKMLHGERVPAAEVKRLTAEARTLAGLDHPHVVPIYEVGQSQGRPYFTAKLLAGGTLAQHLGRIGADPRQVVILMEKVARAVQYLHERGILHRDLKPANVLLDERDEPYVCDFGLAKLREGTLDLTLTGVVMGTLPYMAPEQAAGQTHRIDERTEVWTLGVILYELVTGRRPFLADRRGVLARQIRKGKFPPGGSVRPGIDPSLQAIIHGCLQLEPEYRYPTAASLADDLAAIRQGRAPRARRGTALGRVWRWMRRNPGVSGLMVVAGGLAAAVAALAVNPPRPQPSSEVARASAEQALSLLEQGETARGLHRLVRTLELTPPSDAALDRAVRLNLAAWLPCLYALRDVRPLPGAVGAFAVHPKGRSYLVAVYTAEKNRGEVQLIDADTLAPLGPPFAGGKAVRAVSFGPDGESAVTGTDDGTVRLWNPRTGEPLGPPMVQRSPIRPAFAVAAVGTALAGPLAAGWVPSHAVTVGEGLHERVAAVFYPARDRLVTISSDAMMWRWDPLRGSVLRMHRLGPGTVRAATFSLDGAAVALGYSTLGARPGDLRQGGRVQVWDLANGQPLSDSLPHAASVNAVAFDPSGRRLVTGADDSRARVWDLDPDGPRQSLDLAHDMPVQAVTFSPNGKLLFCGTGRWLVRQAEGRLWDASSGQPLGNPMPHKGLISAAYFQPDGKGVVTASHDRAVRRWGGQWEAQPLYRLPHPGRVNAVAFGPEAVTGGEDGTVRLWSARSGEPAGQLLTHGAAVNGVCFLPGTRTLASLGSDRFVRMWDVPAGRERASWPVAEGGLMTALAAGTDGRFLVTGGSDGQARLWEMPDGDPAGSYVIHPEGVLSIGVRGDGKKVVLGTTGGRADVWSLNPRRRTAEVVPSTRPIRAACFSPDGRTILVAGDDKLASVHEAETGHRMGQPMAHPDFILTACFSPDGRSVMTGSADGFARLWDVATGLRLGPPLRHPGRVRAVAVDASGAMALAGCDDGALVWGHPQPMPGPAAFIRRQVEAATGLELKGDTVLETLAPAEWAERAPMLE